jgi:hypothetical protein
MPDSVFRRMAAEGARVPLAVDLVLHEQPDPEAILTDGERLGRVLEAHALRYGSPAAFPRMDLRLEKRDLLHRLGIAGEEADTYHFLAPPPDEELARVRDGAPAGFLPAHQAHFDSIRYIAEATSLFPVGMTIGPFSLATKLVADPITPVALAGRGLGPDDDESIRMFERSLEMAEATVARSIRAQLEAGARAVIFCEPSANAVYLSPRQLTAGSDILNRYVVQPNLRLRTLLDDAGAAWFLHDCGELTDSMVQILGATLHPAVLSLGASRCLWQDAALVPEDVVLYGNLPTKTFYSDAAMPVERVAELAGQLAAEMNARGRPFILGSECDVLYVPEAAATIRRKLETMVTA